MQLKSSLHPTLISFSCLLPLVIAILNSVVLIPVPLSILLLIMYILIKICILVWHVLKSHKMVSYYKLCFCNLLGSLSILEIHPCWYMNFRFMHFNYCIVFHCRKIAQYIYLFSCWWTFWCFQVLLLQILWLWTFSYVFWCNIFSRVIFFSFFKNIFSLK